MRTAFAIRQEFRQAMKRYLIAVVSIPLFVLALPADDEDPPLKPVNLPLNTEKDENDPHPSSNHLTLLYTTNARGKLEIMISERKKVDEPWMSSKVFPDLVSKEADFRSPFLTADGKYPQNLYYASNKDPEKKDRKGDNYDIYFLVKPMAKADFSYDNAVITIGTPMDEMHPWQTADNRSFYFSRKTEGGWRLFYATRPPDGGQVGDPVKVDVPLGFHHATLTPDGKTMYLQGPVPSKTTKQRWGLFRTTGSGKTWARPEPLTALNSADGPTGDMSPALSRDGSVLYFVSDRPGGKGGLDIWM